jgi:anti-anti-sigma factor
MTESSWKYLRCPVVVLRINQDQVHGDALAETLRDELLAVYERSGTVNVVLDLGQVTYLSSAGIRPLLGLNRRIHENGGRMVLCNLQPEIAGVLSITRLIQGPGSLATFETQPDVPGAVASLYQAF